jgi:hypothetical protein
LKADSPSWRICLSVPFEWQRCHFLPGLDRPDGPWIAGDGPSATIAKSADGPNFILSIGLSSRSRIP